MSGTTAEQILTAIENECKRLQDVRSLTAVSITEWYGVGVTLANQGKACFRIFADYRDKYVDVNFMSPVHIDDKGIYVKWPHCDEPFHRFALWQILKAQGLPWYPLSGSVDPGDLVELEAFLKRAVDLVLSDYMHILDGDLSIVQDIEPTRVREVLDSDRD